MPLFRGVIDSTSQEHFETLIDPLRLTIGLGVICRTKLQFDVVELEQFFPKSTDEYFVSVSDNGQWQPMKLNHIIQYYFGYVCSSKRVFQWNEVGILREAVYHNQDRTVAIRFWQALNEIHGDLFPSTIRNR